MVRTPRHRFGLYCAINVGFALLVGIAGAAGGYPNPRYLNVILLFALCSSAFIDVDGMSGRYSLLALFMFVYFVSYAGVDLSNLLVGSDRAVDASDVTPMSRPELVILVGGILWTLGYRMMVALSSGRSTSRVREWSKRNMLIAGVFFWGVGTVALYRWNVYIIPDTTNEAYRKGLASIDMVTTTAYLIAQMCQPVGELLFAYAWATYRSPYLLALVIAMVIVQVFIGFVIDIKGVAMLGIILVIMTCVMVDGRIPKAWLLVGLLFVTLIFPFFNAYRAAVHGAGIARTTVVQDFGRILEITIAAEQKVNSGRERAMTFLERSSVKTSTEVIVERAGNGVEFQRGHTLAPILAAFVPKMIWADKVRIPTGQLFNKQFHLDDSDDISISPSYLGELYWNFGWMGVIVGMAFLGMTCGYVGAAYNLAEFRTVTRVLVMVITIKQLIVGFEGAITENFVEWLRSLAAIGLLHLVMARIWVTRRSPAGPQSAEAFDAGDSLQPFPNLLT